MENFCSHCGQRIGLRDLPQYREVSDIERLGIVFKNHHPYFAFTKNWHSVNVHLTAKEMEEERERMRANGEL